MPRSHLRRRRQPEIHLDIQADRAADAPVHTARGSLFHRRSLSRRDRFAVPVHFPATHSPSPQGTDQAPLRHHLLHRHRPQQTAGQAGLRHGETRRPDGHQAGRRPGSAGKDTCRRPVRDRQKNRPAAGALRHSHLRGPGEVSGGRPQEAFRRDRRTAEPDGAGHR